jgi:hypothetical protein
MSGWKFTMKSFALNNTRSLHEDTNYVCLGLSVNGKVFAPLAQRIGNVNNGTHKVNVSLPLSTLDSNDQIVFSYLVINHGGGSTQDVLAHCQSAMTQTPLKDFNAVDAQLVPVQGGSVPKCMESKLRAADDLKTWWNLIKSQFTHLSSDRCDGPVAIDRFSLMGSSVTPLQLASQANPFSFIYLGIDSAVGCGSNSDYSVQWSIQAA